MENLGSCRDSLPIENFVRMRILHFLRSSSTSIEIHQIPLQSLIFKHLAISVFFLDVVCKSFGFLITVIWHHVSFAVEPLEEKGGGRFSR